MITYIDYGGLTGNYNAMIQLFSSALILHISSALLHNYGA